MKTCVKKSFVVPALVASLGSVLVGQVSAQTFRVLHSFRSTNYGEGDSQAGLVLIDRTLFGTANALFKLNTDGRAYTVFDILEGCYPQADLVVSDGNLYGTGSEGGISGNGTVFKVNTDGTSYVVLHGFTAVPQYPSPGTNNDGGWPRVTGYTLHSSFNLASSAIWTSNFPVPVVVNGQNTVTNLISAHSSFSG
jgi:uncharacterized repeat protein (TIGR03803 family)